MRQITGIYRPKNSIRSENWKYEIKNTANGASQVMIYDAIGSYGVTAENFTGELSNLTGDIELHLNSEGGDVFDGIAIYNALAQRPGNVRIIVDSLAASIASIIAMAASPGQLLMAKNATMMIHEGQGACIGDAKDMQKMSDLLNMTSDNLASIYADRTGKSSSFWRNKMKDESWFTTEQAIASGLADGVLASDKTKKVENMTKTENTDSGKGVVLGIESMPVDWSPISNKALPVHHTATVDSTWDGPAAVAAMPNKASVLQYCHAWQDSSSVDSDNDDSDMDADDMKTNYKFPHHTTKGGPANLNGVRNGLARLSQAHIPDGDRTGVEAHLHAHLSDGTSDDSSESDDTSNSTTFLPFAGESKNTFLHALKGAQ